MDAHISGIENVGSRLRMVRLEKDHTQGELGDLAGTNQASIQKIENGKSIRPRMIMELAEAVDVNPAWLQFGEFYAVKERPAEFAEEPNTEQPSFADWLKLADQLIESTTKDQLAGTARLLAMNLAHYQIRFGEIPLENFAQLMETQEIDSRTARLVATGMESLVGVLGLVTGQNDESPGDLVH